MLARTELVALAAILFRDRLDMGQLGVLNRIHVRQGEAFLMGLKPRNAGLLCPFGTRVEPMGWSISPPCEIIFGGTIERGVSYTRV